MEGSIPTFTPQSQSSIGTTPSSSAFASVQPPASIPPPAFASVQPPASVQHIASVQPAPAAAQLPATQNGKRKSLVWQHFTEIMNSDGSRMADPRAKCNYCPRSYACGSKANGTTSMRTHMF